jgi:hypothetical protein
MSSQYESELLLPLWNGNESNDFWIGESWTPN